MTNTIRVERTDYADELSVPRETPEGFLVVEAFVSRPGIYRYINTREDEAEGLGPVGAIRLELRPESEVFSEKSIATYRSRSITVGHPRKDGKRIRVDASNVRNFEVGVVEGSARRVGNKLAATLLIKDKAAIAEVKAKGKRQLSPGHLTELVIEKGVDPKYGRYDAIQTDIEVNHLALVEKARGGDSLQMRMDGEEIHEDDLHDTAPAARQQRNDAIERSSSARRDAQYKAIADAARKAGDMATAAWWDDQRVNPDYAVLPPGMSSGRLREIAGNAGADSPSAGGDGNAYLRGVLVQHLLKIIGWCASPELRMDAIDENASFVEREFARGLIRAAGGREGTLRLDAAQLEAKRKLDDEWNNGWKRPAKSAEMLRTTRRTTDAERRDEASSSWDNQWKQRPRSDAAFVVDTIKEPARGGGMPPDNAATFSSSGSSTAAITGAARATGELATDGSSSFDIFEPSDWRG